MKAAERRRVVMVCVACLRASCLAGEHYCEDYHHAGVRRMTVGELTGLGLEHPSHWKPR